MSSKGQVARKHFVTGIVSAFMLAPAPTVAAEGLTWNGFVQSHVAARTADVNCPAGTECNFPSADLRGDLTAEGKNAAGNAGFFGRFDLLRDFALDEARLLTRELYGDLRSEKVTGRLGRQVITWGVGDLLFINDTFPKDPVALFTGQPLEYFKLGSDALKVNAYPAPANLELVVARFRADNTPTSRRFVLAEPFPAALPRRTEEPGDRAHDLEVSGRVFGYCESWELAGYASRTHYHTPARRVTAGEIVGTFPRLNTLGASLTGPALKGVLSLETGYYDSVQDREGRNPSIDNSQFRSLVGYSRQVWDDTTVGVQLYGEWMRNYSAYRETLPADFPAKDYLRKVATFRYTQLFAHQTVTFNIFTFVGLSEKDHYIIPSLRYAFSDSLWVEIGANVFGGNRRGTFGSLQDNSNVYITVRFAL